MPFFQLVAEAKNLDQSLINRCRDEADAVLLCWAKRRIKGMTMTEAARIMGMPKSHLSNILNGQKYPPYNGRLKLQLLCGNWAIRQYEDKLIGATSTFLNPAELEIKRLKEENEMLRLRSA